MRSKGFQSKHGVLWNTRNKGKWPNKKTSSLSICSFRLGQLRIFRQWPTLKSPLRYQQSHSLKSLQTFNLCSAWESYRLLGGIQNPIQTLQSPWVEQITEARPVTANALSHSTWSRIIQKSQFLPYFCPLVQWGKFINSQISYHWLNGRLKVARSSPFKSWALYRFYNTPQTKHLTVSQCLYLGLFDAAKFPPPVLSISFLIGLHVNETELTDCGMSTCWADILLPPPCLSDF